MADEIRPECRKSLDNMESDIKDIHDVIYKDGLVTQVKLNAHNIEQMMRNMNKAIWLLAALIVGFIGEFIFGLMQGP